MYQKFSVQDKVIIVTGASRGLGFAYAWHLAKCGAKVAICSHGAEGLQMAQKRFSDEGLSVFAQVVDVSDSAAVERFVDSVQAEYGRIDALINNAGVLLRRTLEEMTEAEWDYIMDTNVKGTFLFAQAVGKYMIQQGGGSIVNIASIGGKVALGRRLGYCTSKAAVEHFTKVLADEWGKYQVRVNAIAPGYIKSDMNADLRADPVMYQQMVSDVSLGRFGEPEDLVCTAIFLCSEASSFVTGQTIYVDGGKTTH